MTVLHLKCSIRHMMSDKTRLWMAVSYLVDRGLEDLDAVYHRCGCISVGAKGQDLDRGCASARSAAARNAREARHLAAFESVLPGAPEPSHPELYRTRPQRSSN